MLDEADIWGNTPTRGTGTFWDYHLPLLQKTIPLSRRAEYKREVGSDCTLLSDTSDCCASATTTNRTAVTTVQLIVIRRLWYAPHRARQSGRRPGPGWE